MRCFCSGDSYFKTTSPQGDGNCELFHGVHVLSVDFKTISPQGDGNYNHRTSHAASRILFQNHIPARGRKHNIGVVAVEVPAISKPYPRKGTETSARYTDSMPRWYFKTISPQGDGNCDDFASHFLMNDFKTISPQGDGNKSGFLFSPSMRYQFQNHIPVRGRNPRTEPISQTKRAATSLAALFVLSLLTWFFSSREYHQRR